MGEPLQKDAEVTAPGQARPYTEIRQSARVRLSSAIGVRILRDAPS